MFETEKVKGDTMFSNCLNLIGGLNTKYDPKRTDALYARIDEGEDNIIKSYD